MEREGGVGCCSCLAKEREGDFRERFLMISQWIGGETLQEQCWRMAHIPHHYAGAHVSSKSTRFSLGCAISALFFSPCLTEGEKVQQALLQHGGISSDAS